MNKEEEIFRTFSNSLTKYLENKRLNASQVWNSASNVYFSLLIGLSIAAVSARSFDDYFQGLFIGIILLLPFFIIFGMYHIYYLQELDQASIILTHWLVNEDLNPAEIDKAVEQIDRIIKIDQEYLKNYNYVYTEIRFKQEKTVEKDEETMIKYVPPFRTQEVPIVGPRSTRMRGLIQYTLTATFMIFGLLSVALLSNDISFRRILFGVSVLLALLLFFASYYRASDYHRQLLAIQNHKFRNPELLTNGIKESKTNE
jgi:hypothetical protein